MRKQFVEYYDLAEDQIKDIWENSLIVFDTNVLLNLYRYTDEARDEFLKIIEAYNDRLWIPYQVGLEFHRRRTEIIRKHSAAYKEVSDELSEQLVKAIETVASRYSRHPYIDFKALKKKVQRSADSIKRSLIKQMAEHPDLLNNDPALDALTRLFDGRTGSDFTDDMLEDLYKEGERRYSNKVPPGYCDEKNKKGQDKRSIYGDLIVWKQVIHYCKEKKTSVIFITDDHKSDWWEKVDGKHSPRKELIKEFVTNTGCDILIYDSQRFLEYAKVNTNFKVSSKTIKEVAKLQILRYNELKNLWDSFAEYKDLFASEKYLNLRGNTISQYDWINDYVNHLTNYNWIDTYKQLHELLKRFQLHEHQQMNDDVVSHHSDK